jgi:hypothetical protein
MALQKQIIEWRAGSGIDTKTEAKIVDNNLLALENSVFTKASSLQKRYGITPIGGQDSSGTALTSSTGICTYDKELLQFANGNIYSYSPATGKMISKGKFDNVISSVSSVYSNNYVQTSQNAGSLNGITVYVWEDSVNAGYVFYSVIDESSGVPIVAPTQLALGVQPKVIACGTFLYISYIHNSNITIQSISTSTPYSISTPVNIESDLHATIKLYDIVSTGITSTDYMLLVYPKASTGVCQLVAFDQTLNTGSGSNGLPAKMNVSSALPVNGISIVYNLNHIYITYSDASNLWATILTITPIDFTSVKAVFEIDSATIVTYFITSVVISGTVYCYYTVNNATSMNILIKLVTYDTTGVIAAPAVFKRSLSLASKAFTYNNRIYFTAVYLSTNSTPLQATYFIVRGDGYIVSRSMTGAAGAPTTYILPEVPALSASSFLIPVLEKGVLQSEAGNLYTNTGFSKINLTFSNVTPYTAQLGENLHIAGGVLRDYDGTSIFEHGFHIFPDGVTTTKTSGGSLTAGSYQVVVVWEWLDAKGQVHQSTPSIPSSQTLTSETRITVSIPPLRITDKSNVSIVVYCTDANGTIFYRSSSVSSPIINTPTVDTAISYNIDSITLSNELLYTTGEVLSSDVPDSCTCIVSYNNRLFTVSDKANQLVYSKTHSLGQAIGFSDYLNIQCDTKGGTVKAVAVLDDKLIVFKDRSIFFITGQGPVNTGDSNDLTAPQLIPSDVGLSDINSIVLTPAGLMFNSVKGIHLLDHALNVGYIGAPVEAFNNLAVNAAVSTDMFKEVRFTTASSTLVYNYYFQQWSVFTYGGVGAVNWQGIYILDKGIGDMHQESSLYLDNSQTYSQKLITPWFKMNKLQGFGRVWKIFVLGNFKSNHLLRVSISYNYQSTPTDYFYIDTSVLFGGYWGSGSTWGSNKGWGSEESVYQFRIDPSVQLCESFQMHIEDLQGAQGFTLEGLTFEVGMRDGGFRINQSKVY